MKKIGLAFIALMLCFFLIACTESNERKDSNRDLSSKNDDNNSYSEIENIKDVESAESSSKKRRYMSELKARYSAHEKDGYSLFSILHSGSESEDYNLCVDSKGYIMFEFSGNESFETKVYNNAFVTSEEIREKQGNYMSVNSVHRLRKASNGKVLYTADELNNDYIIDLKYSSDELFKDGYILVLNTQENYDGVTYKLGVLGAEGEWIVPMSADNPIVKAMSEDPDSNADDFTEMRYLGEDILYFKISYITESYESIQKHYFYNIKKNIVTEVNSELTESETRSVLQCAGPFYNGVCVEKYGFGGGICKITTDAKIIVMPANFNEKLHQNIGSMYYDAKNDKVIQMGYTYHEEGFSIFDSKGAIIKKIPNVTLDFSNGFNNKGFAEIVVVNNEGTKYTTVIDINGEFMFEPIKASGVVYLPSVDEDSSEPLSGDKIVDANGKVLYESKDNNPIYYKNGVVKVGEEYIEVIK